MSCPRCQHRETRRLALSQGSDIWEVFGCARCYFVWRTTEPPNITDAERYPRAFRLTESDIASARQVPAIPDLR